MMVHSKIQLHRVTNPVTHYKNKKLVYKGDLMQSWGETEKEKIRTSVANMLASSLFAGSPRQQRFLNYLVTNTLNGDASRLKGYTIALEVFDRKGDFDPSLDAIVRVEATRLRNKLREYYDEQGKANEVRIDFPKGSYQLDFSFQSAANHDRDSGLLAKASNSIERRQPALITDRPSLVVLPFVSISADNSRDYFADGMTDSLISMLSHLSGLFVISRQSSFVYKGSMKSSKEIAAELGVQYLLESSVQHAGDRVRIAAHLVQASDGRHVWSERYDRELKDIFVLQDELTQHIVHALQVELSGAEGKLFGYQATQNIEAHDTLLRGVSTYLKYTQYTVEEAVTLFIKTVALDPNYAAAHAWLARAMCFQWAMFWIRDETILDSALKHAEHAIALDANSPYAKSILGWVYMWRKNSNASIAACRQAVELNPNNAEALLFLSLTLSSAGLGEEALYYIGKAKRLTPTSATLYEYAHGQSYYALKDYKKAIFFYDQGIVLSAVFIPNHISQMYAYAYLGLIDEAKQKQKMLNEMMGYSKDLPSISIWTGEEIEKERVEIAKKIFTKN